MPRRRRPPPARDRAATHFRGDAMTTETMQRSATPNLTLAILLGGLAAGFLDICFASALSGAMPDRVFKYIAAGWVGLSAARAGGIEMVLLGAASHFGLALIFAAF